MSNNQIDSSSQAYMGGGSAGIVNQDQVKLDMQSLVNEFMNNPEIRKRIKQLQGRG